MVLINLDSLPEANSPNTKHVLMEVGSHGAGLSLVQPQVLLGDWGWFCVCN